METFWICGNKSSDPQTVHTTPNGSSPDPLRKGISLDTQDKTCYCVTLEINETKEFKFETPTVSLRGIAFLLLICLIADIICCSIHRWHLRLD